MKSILVLLVALVTVVTIQHCSKSSNTTEPNPPPPAAGGLTAVPASVRIMPGNSAAVVVSGGISPDTILIPPASNIATCSLADSIVTIHGVAVGGTSVRIGDHGSPQHSVDIGITVATTPVAIMTTARPR